MPTADVSTASRRTAVGIEDRIRREGLETGVLIGADGRVLARHQGQPDQVGFSPSELALAKDATFTHNHPAGHGPSLEDALMGAMFGMREVRVVTDMFRHGILRLDSGLMIPLQAAFGVQELDALASVRDDLRKRLLVPADITRETRHRTWLRLANALGFEYWRERS